jgi:hypothetical protein
MELQNHVTWTWTGSDSLSFSLFSLIKWWGWCEKDNKEKRERLSQSDE